MSRPTLSTINPDFDDIEAQLRLSLSNKNTWKALLDVETGSILIGQVAAAATMLMTAIQNSAEELNSDTAKLESSLRAISRTLGVRLSRKLPGSAAVTLSIPSQVSQFVIPAYSTFSASGVTLFNREAILIPALTTSINVTLYEGKVQQLTVQGSGSALQVYIVDVPGFTISDTDVVVVVNGQDINVVTDGLWHYPVVTTPIKVVQDRTLPTGELELLFGNELFGIVPGSTQNIQITYVLTNGAAGNSISFSGQAITYAGSSLVTGVATTPIVSGADEQSAEVYRNSPLLYAGYGRAVSIPDHDALALQYPGLVDALFFGQNDIAPNLKEFMNVVYVYLLEVDGTQPTLGEFADFKTWLQPKAAPLDYVRKESVAVPITVTANVFIKSNGDAVAVRGALNASLTSLFTPTKGFLGRNLYLSDIYDALKDADPAIDYVELTSPTTSTICRVTPPSQLFVAPSLTLGSLVPGETYTYVVSSVNAQGETFPSQTAPVVVPPGTTSVLVTWTPVPGVVAYRIYGRVAGVLGKLGADIPANTTSYLDTGAAVPGVIPNESNTSGLSHVTLASSTFNIDFTSRK